ncbi:unnamed protein product [Phytophthora fragariaefolia]|uniref:Unnamed protein product n=1 Tax=Phytophthora fragariaefolia TaxID=1490495 RepID=A0A9W7CSA9_9STRA|nr:unnamed protein product [Phytophthora fragariaefolia]
MFRPQRPNIPCESGRHTTAQLAQTPGVPPENTTLLTPLDALANIGGTVGGVVLDTIPGTLDTTLSVTLGNVPANAIDGAVDKTRVDPELDILDIEEVLGMVQRQWLGL